LYRPFAKPPQQLHQELEAKKSKLTEWSHLRVVNLNQARGASTDEQVSYLEQIPTTKESAVLSEKLGDLCAALGKPSSTVHAYERALKLDPSPQQRIRLRLTLGEKQLALNREEEAYANYQKFVVESPDYPEKTPIYQKLLTLAQKLGKKEDEAKYTEQIKPPPPIPPN
jgi:tetratricopeptide (TPR) repeat protein